MELIDNHMCFACGRKNPIGLRLGFAPDGEEYTSELEVKENHQGWAGIIHGGILATALDEVMARLLADKGYHAITVQLEVRFIHPVKVGEKIRLRGRILEDRKRLIRTEAQAFLADGTLAATGKAASLRV
ncbi:MAG: PaaI family thioesterase [Armatimonadetes bacterium]|nr:PaaI family thioesterase [Armatimonadota bacterium]NIM24498.1 PaaI family thioesterase [Armatimonadota bacterium]NIM68370.1 PaaI family thioesterase [Armatimonadota bacterium]NIM76769.1 PaaI family thioesterase [Armatimonadota bacterium]NIN06572.1 PaaI family thioesterase [Armatimonadota bacterium]